MPRTAQTQRQVFRSGSKTYFNSSLFFPSSLRSEVYVLYGFVRVADNYVDAVPQQGEAFYRFRDAYLAARDGKRAEIPIIDDFVDLERRRHFDFSWADAFFHSMELDLTKKVYATIDESLEYVYGSAEVIGLYMARLMELPGAADHAARMLGRSMQFINFIRDIDEDNGLGRTYLPIGECGLPNLLHETATAHREQFGSFVGRQIERYRAWQREAEAGYQHIPRRYLAPIRTAADMYVWTAERIARDPFIVFSQKVKPTRSRIIARIAKYLFLSDPSKIQEPYDTGSAP